MYRGLYRCKYDCKMKPWYTRNAHKYRRQNCELPDQSCHMRSHRNRKLSLRVSRRFSVYMLFSDCASRYVCSRCTSRNPMSHKSSCSSRCNPIRLWFCRRYCSLLHNCADDTRQIHFHRNIPFLSCCVYKYSCIWYTFHPKNCGNKYNRNPNKFPN